jgi:5-methylcytosine-specific restriction endonuclease McrA
MTKCPICENEFKNMQGVRSHAAQSHGENPVPKRVEYKCDYCNSKFEREPSVLDATEKNFCDKECHKKWQSECRPTEKHNWYRGGPEVVECVWCGEKLERKPAIVKDSEYFCCSVECEGKWKSENKVKENHPNWKGGHKKSYGPNWNQQRNKRLERDDYSCVVCGMSNEEHKEQRGIELHVHHIERKESFRDEDGMLDHKRANRLENLITLCYTCHNRWEGIPLRPEVRE